MKKRGYPMNGKAHRRLLQLTVICGAILPSTAFAQSAGEALLALDGDTLRGELRTRYDAALAGSQDPAIVGANTTRYLWANEAKVQCAIAIGYMKSSTKDETSIRKCGDAYARFMQVPMAPPPVPVVSNPLCDNKIAGIVFFDFDSSTPPDEAGQTVDVVARNLATCGWAGLSVAGHTDRSGSDAYNDALSMRRAQAVVAMLQSRGVSPNSLTVTALGEGEPRVPTADGVREPQNRRVEITVN